MTRKRVTWRDELSFLPQQHIERDAEALLAECSETIGAITIPPVPVDDIVELHLKLAFGIEDLQSLLKLPDVLGAIWFTEKKVSVDCRLDPSGNPRLLGRYRFTLAHEAGHWRLHRKYYVEDPSQGKLFDGRGQPAFVCRSSLKPPAEWQADYFAGCLLMPRELVRSEWQVWRGNLDPVAVQELPAVSTRNDPKENVID